MASQETSNPRGKLKTAILVSLSALVLVAFIAPPSMVVSASKTEMKLTRALVGDSIERDIYDNASAMSRSLVDRQKWRSAVREFRPPLMNHERLTRLLYNRVEAAAALLEAGCYRVASLWAWVFLALPLLAATIVDGTITRKIRQHQFRYTSNTRHTVSGSVIGAVVAFMVAGLLIPAPIPYVATAVLVLPLGALIWSWIANLPKRL